MRTFIVLVGRPGRLPIGYPPVEGERALSNMEKFAVRGMPVMARTTANGITEDLTLDEMRELYSEEVGW